MSRLISEYQKRLTKFFSPMRCGHTSNVTNMLQLCPDDSPLSAQSGLVLGQFRLKADSIIYQGAGQIVGYPQLDNNTEWFSISRLNYLVNGIWSPGTVEVGEETNLLKNTESIVTCQFSIAVTKVWLVNSFTRTEISPQACNIEKDV